MRNLFPLGSALLIYAFSLSSFGNPGLDPIAAADWRVDAKPSVVERNFNKKAVALFVDNFRGVDIEDPELAEPPAKPEQVGDFKWLDIDKDGVYELFLTFAETRAFFGGPSIYKVVNGRKTALQHLSGTGASIDEKLQDLNSDGTPELVLKTSAVASSVSFGTASPKPIWFEIYQWNGQKFEQASRRFMDFYLERQLPAVEARIEEIRSRPPDPRGLSYEEQRKDQAFYEKALAAAYFFRDKILRFTGRDPRAGIDRAREWAKSSNPDLKVLAVDVFRDAGLRTYIADVQLLASDPDPYVARYARSVAGTRSDR